MTLSERNRQIGVGDAVFVQLQSIELCGLLPRYSCDGDATLDGVARVMHAFVKLLWT